MQFVHEVTHQEFNIDPSYVGHPFLIDMREQDKMFYGLLLSIDPTHLRFKTMAEETFHVYIDDVVSGNVTFYKCVVIEGTRNSKPACTLGADLSEPDPINGMRYTISAESRGM